MIIGEETQKEYLVVRHIQEHDEKQIKSFKILVIYFSIILLVKLVLLVSHWVSGSPIDSLWSHVGVSLLLVVGIPTLIYRIKKLRAIDYYCPIGELVNAAKRRYQPHESILLLVLGFLLLLIIFAPSIADGNHAFIWGGISGLVLGSVICYVSRRKFIRTISDL